jgi:hypothetical protein
MCLDDQDGRTSDRSPIQQYTCNETSTTMQWMMGTGDGNGYNPLLNMRALQNGGSACLDVAGGSYEAGRSAGDPFPGDAGQTGPPFARASKPRASPLTGSPSAQVGRH